MTSTTLRASWILAGRNLLLMRRYPLALVSALVLPPLVLLIFLALFNKSGLAQGLDYIQYVTPTLVIQTMFFAGSGAGYAVGMDIRDGLFDRWRTLPISRLAVVVGRLLGDAVRALSSLVLVLVCAVAFGFHPPTEPIGVLGGLGVCLLTMTVISLGCQLLAVRNGDPEATESTTIPVFMVCLIISNGLVPTANFPNWLEPIIRWGPISLTSDTLRAFIDGRVDTRALTGFLVWAIGLGVLWSVLLANRYRRDG
ncbi:ABC transporter permease [Nocardia sp. NPDC051321]|uniref:ABC transporter permease n=1 Tax=Nocardia sp. NPDC051321 TaxID=3364323 RepID=UPI0037970477